MLLHVGGAGGRSQTQGPIRERESAPEVLLERRECVKVARREWKAALKFIAGGSVGEGMGGGTSVAEAAAA